MFAILLLPERRTAYLDFGEPFSFALADPEAHLRWVLASYDARRDEQWVLTPPQGAPIVARLLAEAAAAGKAADELNALRALGWYGLPEYVSLVIPYATDPRELVRRAAVHALGQLVHYDTIPILQTRLASDPSPDVQREALAALGKMGKLELLPEIERAGARGPDFALVAEEARQRTIVTAKRDLEALALHLVPSRDYEDLCVFMTWVDRVVEALLADPARPLEVRLHAARLLGLARQRRAFNRIGQVLARPTEPTPLRMECAIALGRLEHPRSVDALVEALDDPSLDDGLHSAVIDALGRTGSDRAIAPLLQHFDDRLATKHERVRNAVRDAARRAGPRRLLEDWLWTAPREGVSAVVVDRARWSDKVDPAWLLSSLDSPEADVRRDALLLLAHVGDKSSLPRVERVVREDAVLENQWLAAVVHRRLAAQ